MSDGPRTKTYYLVEWYCAELSAEAMDVTFAQLTAGTELPSAKGSSATVMMTITVPSDDVVFCILRASSPDVVTAACERAGLPADRVSAAMVAA
jgi:hypothetical protein